MTDWAVGMRAECIEDPGWRLPPGGPKKGDILVVTGVAPPPWGKCWYLRFADRFPTCSYREDFFRPAEEKGTDISVFEAMLTKAPRVLEPAS
jgi:hypothetical protein